MARIILASGSPRRRDLLSQIGVQYEVITSDADETINESNPAKVVEELSRRKAEDIATQLENNLVSASDFEDIIVIGADTVVALEDKILGKPEDEKMAYQMIQSLQGRSHSVYTGVTMVFLGKDGKRTESFYEETKVEVVSMTKKQIDDYIATGEPMDKAGAYGIQGAFAAYIKGIVGDYYNVVGLPVCQVASRL